MRNFCVYSLIHSSWITVSKFSCVGTENKTNRINEVNVLIKKALRCINYKIYDEILRNLKKHSYWKLSKYELCVRTNNFNKYFLLVIFDNKKTWINIKYIHTEEYELYFNFFPSSLTRIEWSLR